MLLRVKPNEIEIGMFVHGFEGRWIDHPFWRSRFLVESPKQLARIKQSDIDLVVIDDSRGSHPPISPDNANEGNSRHRRPARSRVATSASLPGKAIPSAATLKTVVRRKTYAPERRRAARVIDKSRQAVADLFDSARLGRAVEARALVPLAQAVGNSIQRDSKALLNLARLKDKDQYTYLHSVSVCALMINFARRLEFDEAVVQDLGVAGLLHDIGKVAIADTILRKPGKLNLRERSSVERHPLAGYDLLRKSPEVSEVALEICRHHHEKVDGTGYPDRLQGERLSLYARMAAICDVYDAVTSDRAYKAAWSPCEALTAMQSWPGHFDPKLLDRFADSLGIYPVGTLVRLSNGLLGLVMGSGGDTGETVVVRGFFDCDNLTEFEPIDLEIAPCAENPRIISRDNPSFWRFDNWDAMRGRIMAATVDALAVKS